jgi:hypothetical protein
MTFFYRTSDTNVIDSTRSNRLNRTKRRDKKRRESLSIGAQEMRFVVEHETHFAHIFFENATVVTFFANDINWYYNI